MCGAVTADRGFTWSDEETGILLRLWGDTNAQSELTGCKRNFVVYEKISETMGTMGYVRTASQCREKIKRMKREYTLTKQHNDRPNAHKKSMRFYEQFEKILFEKQGKNQKNAPLKIRPQESEIDDNEKTTTKKCERVLRPLKMKTPVADNRKRCELEKEAGNPWTPDVVLVEGEDTSPQALFESQHSASTNSTNGELCSTRKRKLTSRMSFFQNMMDSLTQKFMKHQADSDERLLSKLEQLEGEQAAMDERLQKMWVEFEEKRLSDQREHEMNVMNLFQQIVSPADKQ